MGCHESSPEVSEGQVEISDFPRDLTKLKSERENSIFFPGMRQKGTLIFPYGMKFNSPSILARLRGNALRKASINDGGHRLRGWHNDEGSLYEAGQARSRPEAVLDGLTGNVCFHVTSMSAHPRRISGASRNIAAA